MREGVRAVTEHPIDDDETGAQTHSYAWVEGVVREEKQTECKEVHQSRAHGRASRRTLT